MKKIIALFLPAILLAPFALAADGDQYEAARALMDKDCVNCHNSELFQEGTRKVADLGGLQKLISACVASGKLGWNKEQEKSVADYLNAEFYKFK